MAYYKSNVGATPSGLDIDAIGKAATKRRKKKSRVNKTVYRPDEAPPAGLGGGLARPGYGAVEYAKGTAGNGDFYRQIDGLVPSPSRAIQRLAVLVDAGQVRDEDLVAAFEALTRFQIGSGY